MRGDDNVAVVVADEGQCMMDKEEDFSNDGDIDEEQETGKGAQPNGKKKGWFSSMFQSMSGNAVLDKSDLEPAMKSLKDRLMTKNVAEEIAEKLCESVPASLEGKKIVFIHRFLRLLRLLWKKFLFAF